jgi:hypothetical protein
VPATIELRADESTPAISAVTGKDDDRPAVDAYSELMRRARNAPLNFSFAWHGMDFGGTLESIEGGMRMSLQSKLAELPYSAEDARARGNLLAVVDTLDGHTEGLLKVVKGQTIVLENEIPMPRTPTGSISSVVTNLALLVLNAAPYLDLIAEFANAEEAV